MFVVLGKSSNRYFELQFVFHDEDRIERVENVKSLTDYIDRIDEMIARKEDFLAGCAGEL